MKSGSNPLLSSCQYNLSLEMQVRVTESEFPSKQLKDALKSRLAFHSIYRQISLLTCMNPKMEIQLRFFQKLDILAQLSEREIELALKTVPYVQILSEGCSQKGLTARFEYKFSPGIVIVTGFNEQPLSRLLFTFEQILKKPRPGESSKQHPPRKILHNGFFTLIECHTRKNADNLKCFLRSRKKYMEDRSNTQFKAENQRIRIFSVDEENLFNFLVDMMSQYKAQKFFRSMDADINFIKKPSLPQGSTTYRMFSHLQLPLFNSRPITQNKQLEQYELESLKQKAKQECKKEEEDVWSDQTCFTSDNFDKLQDIVEDQTFKPNEIFFLELQSKEK